ncbi:MAG: hypothetical protein LBF72_01325, partial [Holosporales bacterium]|nr:hypothetical protein [Holosporales bacterium]
RNSRTSKYAPLLCSVSTSQNSEFEGFERGPLYVSIRATDRRTSKLFVTGLPPERGCEQSIFQLYCEVGYGFRLL